METTNATIRIPRFAYIWLLDPPEGDDPPIDVGVGPHGEPVLREVACDTCGRIFGGDAWVCLHKHAEHGV